MVQLDPYNVPRQLCVWNAERNRFDSIHISGLGVEVEIPDDDATIVRKARQLGVEVDALRAIFAGPDDRSEHGRWYLPRIK